MKTVEDSFAEKRTPVKKAKIANAKSSSKSWIWKFVSGQYGYNADVFLEVIVANHSAKTIYKKMVRDLRKKGIEI